MHAFGPVVLLDTVAAEHLAGARLYYNARYFLDAATQAPIPATKSLGNLTRGFVERAAAEMRWPSQSPDIVRFINPALDELDLPGLHRLRVVLERGRLLRNYRGAFHSTAGASALMTAGREGELYVALFEAYFKATELALLDGYPSDPHLQQATPRILWLLGRMANGATTVGELAKAVPVDSSRWPVSAMGTGFERLCAALRHRILEPLEDFDLALLDPSPASDSAGDDLRRQVQVTELFERLVVAAADLN